MNPTEAKLNTKRKEENGHAFAFQMYTDPTVKTVQKHTWYY